MSTLAQPLHTIRTQIPARLDPAAVVAFHWRVVLALGKPAAARPRGGPADQSLARLSIVSCSVINPAVDNALPGPRERR